ncbi:uncharacterized protein MONBRDRAFT_15331 [Monosiga brevicollis MX1]|uniref:NAD-dependent epimerase/dehydratase domain-containing protein n=1 Tax=Monosiga brevicollis TaxID=81824 RepID=A9UT71_MONBE|nr:uncharacterized protein MONBRDRAFT_15331 [Monosiga brevicollis MX1]EDQ91442.1 predicted protein [Monosiga brevicollis MX1]|eukprot:XP_001743864.1 hypothetical protein [Monosiga brevicollis MX1]
MAVPITSSCDYLAVLPSRVGPLASAPISPPLDLSKHTHTHRSPRCPVPLFSAVSRIDLFLLSLSLSLSFHAQALPSWTQTQAILPCPFLFSLTEACFRSGGRRTGAGFIGRNLVVYLVENNLADVIRVVDKAILQTAYLTARQQAAFEKVDFQQGNLTRDATIQKAFARDGGAFDFVFNCAGLTTYGQAPEVYQESVFDLSVKCARAAAQSGCRRFIELSTAQVYAADKKASAEDGKVKPWTALAEKKLAVENELKAIDGLDYCIVRPANVYGVSDRQGLMPRLITAAVYKKLGETMKFLWSDKLCINTVHVSDVAAALWTIAERGVKGEVYNLADKANSTQGSVADLLAQLFGIEVGFVGSTLSNMARLNMSAVVETSNEKHMEPWSRMCVDADIGNTPLTPYLDKELLYNNSLAVDGSKIEALGFEYKHPAPTLDLLRDAVEAEIELKNFPTGYLV